MILKLNDISFVYPDNITAIKDVSFEVPNKSFVAILGESGCGKTTLLKIIAGLVDPQKGNVIINDEDVTNFTTASRDVTMQFQEFTLMPHLTIYENVLLSLNGIKISNEEKDQLVKSILTKFGLRNYLNFKPRHLSIGQQQRVAICKSLVREPLLFLMDEPFSNIDKFNKGRLLKELKYVYENMNSSFVFATHNHIDAEFLSTYVIVLDKSKLLQKGTFSEIKENPVNEKVTNLIYGGEINSFDLKNDKFENIDKLMENYVKKPSKFKKIVIPYKCLSVDEEGLISGKFVTSKIVNGNQLITIELDNKKELYAYVDESIEFEIDQIVKLSIKGKYYLF